MHIFLRILSAGFVFFLLTIIGSAQQPPKRQIDPCSAIMNSPRGVAAMDSLHGELPRHLNPVTAAVGDAAFGNAAVCGKDASGKDKSTCAVTKAEIDDQRKTIEKVESTVSSLTTEDREAYTCAISRLRRTLDATEDELSGHKIRDERASRK